jgi:hypothetical protein
LCHPCLGRQLEIKRRAGVALVKCSWWVPVMWLTTHICIWLLYIKDIMMFRDVEKSWGGTKWNEPRYAKWWFSTWGHINPAE